MRIPSSGNEGAFDTLMKLSCNSDGIHFILLLIFSHGVAGLLIALAGGSNTLHQGEETLITRTCGSFRALVAILMATSWPALSKPYPSSSCRRNTSAIPGKKVFTIGVRI